MKITSKTYLIIGSTFVLGIIAGVLLAPLILSKKGTTHQRRWGSPESFIQRFEEVIQPTAEQRDRIQVILEKHSTKYMNGRKRLMEQVHADMDSLKQQLDPILTADQKKRLNERFNRRQSRRKR